MLTSYITKTQQLLQLPGATTPLYSDANVTGWVNTARGQLAGDGECVRKIGTISTVAGQRPYDFSGLNLGVSATNGIAGAILVRRISYGIASGQLWVPPRPWEWFELYALNNAVPQNGPPKMWSQYAQGSAGSGTGSGASGSFYLDPPPDLVYTLYCDSVCYPNALVDDTTVEAIPYLWTDAVPYFAAYLALLSSQTQARQADADRMMKRYEEFKDRARRSSNPSVLRWQSQQSGDPAQAAKMGLNKGGA